MIFLPLVSKNKEIGLSKVFNALNGFKGIKGFGISKKKVTLGDLLFIRIYMEKTQYLIYTCQEKLMKHQIVINL